MSGERITDLYRQLALHRVEQAIDALTLAAPQALIAQAAVALKRAAGALACMTALYAADGSEIDRRWQDQINDLVAIAATLDTGRLHPPPRLDNNHNH